MDLEERTIEQLPDRCQSCGTVLTAAEKEAVLEAGTGLALCTTCAAEQVPLEEEELEEEAG
jgi:hypothetical protein